MSVGYAFLKEKLGLTSFDPARPALVKPTTRLAWNVDHLAVPQRIAPASDDPIQHLLFALKHEDMELALLMEAMRKLSGNDVLAEVQRTPGGRYTRQLGFFWEEAHGRRLEGAPAGTGAVVDIFNPRRYVTQAIGTPAPFWRVNWNGLGTTAWCATVQRTPSIEHAMASDVPGRVRAYAEGLAGEIRERALSFAYLSETKSSFAIEHELPSEARQNAFVALLHAAHKETPLTEEYLTSLQQATVSNPLDRAVGFRAEQNHLANALPGAAGVTYVPPPPDIVEELMGEMMSFANHMPTRIDPLVAGAVSSFGFVFIHPFMDGNGRLSRFLIHHALCQSGALGSGLMLPVSVAMKKHENDYLETLKAFSVPARARWDVLWEDGERFRFTYRGSDRYEMYRYWDATRAVDFTYRMAEQALAVELRTNVEYLERYDYVIRKVTELADVRGSDLAVLVRSALELNGVVSKRRRDQFEVHTESRVFDLIETYATEALRRDADELVRDSDDEAAA
jgi:Uncharacterized conserved protein